MDILVIGSEGFIGSRIVESLLRRSINVTGTIRNSKSPINSSCLSHLDLSIHPTALVKKNFDIIINSGGTYSKESDREGLKTNLDDNVLLPQRICSLVSKNTKLVLNLGTYFEYAPLPSGEEWSSYSISKKYGRILLRDFCLSRNITFVQTVLYDNYSEDLSRNKFVDSVILSLQNNSQLVMSHGNQVLDLTHLEDIVSGITSMALSSHPNLNNSFQLRSRELYSLNDIVQVAEAISGSKLSIKRVPPQSDTREVLKFWDSCEDWSPWRREHTFRDFLISVL